MNRLKVAVLGATGMVGQRFVTLLHEHPWFETVLVAASPRSAGLPYGRAVADRWKIDAPLPEPLRMLRVHDVSEVETIRRQVNLVFCALDLEAAAIRELENAYAAADVPVVSNNSAHRWTPDVPMIIPEVNPEHLDLIAFQRRRMGWRRGFIVTKPNCSLQSYVPLLAALSRFEPQRIFVTTLQAVSGAGKRLNEAPEIEDNVIPLKSEEEKSEREPLKIFGRIQNGQISAATEMRITAHCNRVAASDGHMAVVSVGFKHNPRAEEIVQAWREWQPEPQKQALPSAPQPAIVYLSADDRPQTRLDREVGRGMAFCAGRLRPCPLFDWRFSGLTHNTIRGAAGGAILTAELLRSRGLLD